MSASTIVPLTMLALAIVISVGNAPEPNLAKVTESSASLVPAILALALISALTIVPSTMSPDVIVLFG